jgi:AcrR family transcriptional regulator
VSRTRTTYHHGDLRNALLAAGAELAEVAGPDAVTIRAVAAKVGVSPTAAYRHFADHAELLEAVRQHAMDRLSDSMRRYLRRVPPSDAAALAALNRFTATGRGYLHFALTEPGLFRTAFATGHKTLAPPQPGSGGPFDMLTDALDDLVAVGYLAPEHRPLAEIAAWSAVHGLADLLIEGPLRGLGRRDRNAVIDRTIEMVAHGMHTAR